MSRAELPIKSQKKGGYMEDATATVVSGETKVGFNQEGGVEFISCDLNISNGPKIDAQRFSDIHRQAIVQSIDQAIVGRNSEIAKKFIAENWFELGITVLLMIAWSLICFQAGRKW